MKNIFQTILFLIYYCPCHYIRVWTRVLDVPGCYKRMAQAEGNSTLQGSGLVRTVGLCAQRVALMSHTYIVEQQALALATKPRAKLEARCVLCHTCQ